MPITDRRLWLCVVFALQIATINAQQTPYTVFYRSNWQFVNPAALDRSFYLSRNHNELALHAGYRQQWLGLEGAPLLYFVSAEYHPQQANPEMPGYQMGLTAFGDKTGALGTYGMYGNYARSYRLPNKDGHVLHIGISAGVQLYQVKQSDIRLPDPSDPALADQRSQAFADFAVGVLYRIRKTFYAGLSMPQTFTLDFQSRASDPGVFAKTRRRHVYLHLGGFFGRGAYLYGARMPDQQPVVIEPSLWVRFVPGVANSTVVPEFPLSADGHVRVHFTKQQVWIGGGYGTNGMLNAEFGIGRVLENGTRWQAGFAYGVPVGSRYLNLGHSAEVTAGYYFYN